MVAWRPDLYDGAWVIDDYPGVCAALRDSRLSARRTGDWLRGGCAADHAQARSLQQIRGLMALALIFQDDEAHEELRTVLQPPLVMASLEGLRASLPALVQRALQTTDPARWLSEWVGAHFLQVDSDWLAEASRDLAPISGLLSAPKAGVDLLQAAQAGVLRQWPQIEAQLRTSDSGPLALLAGSSLSLPQQIAQAMVLMIGTTETLQRLLRAVLAAWEAHPDACRHPLASPGAVVREVARLAAPVPMTARRARETLQIGSAPVQRGQAVVLDLAAACRDPDHWQDADRFDPLRTEGPLPAFGLGPHACLGAALSRLAGEALLQGLRAN